MAEWNKLGRAFHGLRSRDDCRLEDWSFLGLNFLLSFRRKSIFGKIYVGFRSCRSLGDGFCGDVDHPRLVFAIQVCEHACSKADSMNLTRETLWTVLLQS